MKNSIKKIPYGISDYVRIKKENYLYIDKTHYIPKLEEAGSYSMFLRPRRFGKSLLISILETYYDLKYKDEFNLLYGDTYIGKNPTKERNSYHILRFDFSSVSLENVKESFNNNIYNIISNFVYQYKLDIEFKTESSLNMLETVLKFFIKNQDKKLYILIDEYDHFANRLLMQNIETYKDVLKTKSGDNSNVPFYKEFFTILKGGATGSNAPIKRMFITGVTPMTMFDVTSGFNIGKNISTDAQFNNLVGVNSDEFDGILKEYNLDTKEFKEQNLQTIKLWYNHYRFSKKSKETIYNTNMILYYIDNYLQDNEPPDNLIDVNVKSEYKKLIDLAYQDNRLNGNFTTLKTLVSGDSVPILNIVQDFSALDISKENNFKSLLFYLGMVTLASDELGLGLKIPNETIKRIDSEFMANILAYHNIFSFDISHIESRLREFALRGSLEAFTFFADKIKNVTSIRDYIDGEQTIKSMYLAYFSLIPLYMIKSELEMNKGFVDLFLQPFIHYIDKIKHYGLIELKYISRKEKNIKSKITQLAKEAEEQLNRYCNDEILNDYSHMQQHKIILIFHGWELVLIKEV